jgi:hypothetical protein
VQPDHEIEARMKKGNPFEHQHRDEIARDGLAWSSFYAESVTPANVEYETNKHLFWTDAYVHPEHRRQGIATMWLPLIVELMEKHGCTLVGFYAETDAAHEFLKWVGAGPKLTDIESRLKIADLDWTMLERWTAEGAERSPQTKLEIHDGPPPDPMLPEFAPQLSTMLNTMPTDDLDIGKILLTPERIKDWQERQAIVGELTHTVIAREPDGSMSGMTDITWAPYRRTLIHQQFTGCGPMRAGVASASGSRPRCAPRTPGLPDAEWVVTYNARSTINAQINHARLQALPDRHRISDEPRRAERRKSLGLATPLDAAHEQDHPRPGSGHGQGSLATGPEVVAPADAQDRLEGTNPIRKIIRPMNGSVRPVRSSCWSRSPAPGVDAEPARRG